MTATAMWFDTHFTPSFRKSVLNSLRSMLSPTEDLEDYLQNYATKVLINDGFAKQINNGGKISPKTFAHFAKRQALNTIFTGAQDAHNRATTGAKTKREVTLDTTLAPASANAHTIVYHTDEGTGSIIGQDIVDPTKANPMAEIEDQETYRAIYNTISKLESSIPQQHLGTLLQGFMDDEHYEDIATKIDRSPTRTRVMIGYLRGALQDIGNQHTAYIEEMAHIKGGNVQNLATLQELLDSGLVEINLTQRGQELYSGSNKSDPMSWIPVALANQDQAIDSKQPNTQRVLSDKDTQDIFDLTGCFTLYDRSAKKCGNCPLKGSCRKAQLPPTPISTKDKRAVQELVGCFGDHKVHTSKCSSCPLAKSCVSNREISKAV